MSDHAREVWESRINRITNAWLEIEWRSILAGVRSCCLTTVTPEGFVAQAGEWTKQGLSALPLQIQGLSQYSYSATSTLAEPGKPFGFRIVIGTPKNVSNFKKAFDASNDREIGRLLGFPTCCLEFFQQVWVEQGLVDTTWPMAVNTGSHSETTKLLAVKGSPYANILWRWMGIRAVPHLPCSFDCQQTVELGKNLVEVGIAVGYDTEIDWLLEILNWSVEWSVLHGIAEIRTPILKVSTCTDATPIKYIVRREGKTSPLEGAKGLNFPYSTPSKPLLTQSKGYQQGLKNPIKTQSQYPEWYTSDNGFNSRFAMENAHKPIVELAANTLADCGGNVLDLGCGNGVLLKKICEANSEAIPFGIEIDSSRVKHTPLLLPEFADNFICGDMFEDDSLWSDSRRYKLAILMPGRLIEAGSERSAKLKEQLKKHCDNLLVYAYGEWLTRYESLTGLAHKAGILLLASEADAKASLAQIA
ncbi:MAG: hypothetical protein F6K21_15080 [Symploca sp. SIO2D2]|nr:hypothetical protein [Symploca sp. SIO2D2]